MLRESCDAQASGHGHGDSGQGDVGNCGTDSFGNQLADGGICAGQDQSEFLAAIARRKVSRPERASEDGANTCQYLIANRMTVLIVDLFEVVQIKEYQCE